MRALQVRAGAAAAASSAAAALEGSRRTPVLSSLWPTWGKEPPRLSHGSPGRRPDWLALASSSEAHAAGSPTPGGRRRRCARGARALPRRVPPGPALAPSLLCVEGSDLGPASLLRPSPKSCSHMLRTPAAAPLEFQGSRSASRAPAGSEGASRGRAIIRTTPGLGENGKRRSRGRKERRRKK